MARHDLRWLSRATAMLIAAMPKPQFPRLLRRLLHTQLPFSNMILVIYPQHSKPISLHAWLPNTRLHTHYQQHYLTHTYQLDPFYQISATPYRAGCYQLRDLAPDRFFQSEYYQSYYRGSTMVDEICLLAQLDNGNAIHMSMGRDLGLGRFTRAELNFLKNIELVLCALLKQYGESQLPSGPQTMPQKPEALEVRLQNHIDSLTDITPLTQREAQVAALVLKGHSSLSAGLVLNIALDTVKIHRKRVYRKLRVGSQAELFARLSHLLVGLA